MGPKLNFARGRWVALIAAFLLFLPASLWAGTTGNLTGYITNQEGRPVENARITVTSPSLQGTQSATSDEEGFYRVFALPPGVYTVQAEGPGFARVQRENIELLVDQTLRVDLALTPIGVSGVGEGDVIVITEQAPIVEQGSTTIGANLSSQFLQAVPTGRRITTVLNLTPGATQDLLGTSFLGSSSPENNYIIDGINTTGIDYGLPSTNLPIEFIDQIEVKTGGYGAEFGRATGGVVNAILKSGGNEFHGDVFLYTTPFQGQPEPQVYAGGGDPVTRLEEINYDLEFGFDLGGYIVKDKLWFFAGFMPTLRSQQITRTLGDQDRVYDKITRIGYFVGKLTYRLNEDNSVALSVLGNPGYTSGPHGITAAAIAGEESYYLLDRLNSGQLDASLRWNSKLMNDTTNIDLILGYHREREEEIPLGALEAGRDAPGWGVATENWQSYVVGEETNYGVATNAEGATWAAPDCGGRPCQVFGYFTGGNGYVENAERTRISGNLRITHYINNVLGNHKFMWGGDYELNTFDNERTYTGGYVRRAYAASNPWASREQYFTIVQPSAAECETLASDRGTELIAAEQIRIGTDDAGAPVYGDEYACLLASFPAVTTTTNFSAFAQESWSILDNLTLNLGLRWEAQQIRDTQGRVNLGLYNNWAPRLGFIFDPTNEGRAKLFGSYGRFYESIPMDINDRAFSFEGFAFAYRDAEGNLVDMSPYGLGNPYTLGGAGTPIQQDLSSQYLNEFILGAEYEVLNNLSVSGRYIYRSLGRVIEDISPDDGHTYIVANPGIAPATYVDPVTGETIATYEQNGDVCTLTYAETEDHAAETLEVPCFPEAQRTYQGLELTATKRMSDNWTMLASYVLSWAYGNYPGLFTPENGQLDPNITSQFDLPSLLTNRVGFLPQDRRHVVKLHGAYDFDWGLRTGAGLLLQSGAPISYLGSHEVYGEGEAFLAPRGSAGRTPTVAAVDGNLEYAIPLGETRLLSFQVEAFNLFNFQNAIRVDQNYTYAAAYNPQNGQSIEQALCYYDPSLDADGVIDRAADSISYCSEMANPDFATATAFQDPFSLRFGVKFTF